MKIGFDAKRAFPPYMAGDTYQENVDLGNLLFPIMVANKARPLTYHYNLLLKVLPCLLQHHVIKELTVQQRLT